MFNALRVQSEQTIGQIWLRLASDCHLRHWHPTPVIELIDSDGQCYQNIVVVPLRRQKAVFMANKLCDCILVVVDNEDSEQ